MEVKGAGWCPASFSLVTCPLRHRPIPQNGQKLGYDTEAFAIYDTMMYIKPPVYTLCVGESSAPCRCPRRCWQPSDGRAGLVLPCEG